MEKQKNELKILRFWHLEDLDVVAVGIGKSRKLASLQHLSCPECHDNVDTMKLYRGLKAKEFIPFDATLFREQKAGWRKILQKRAVGDLTYSMELNAEILKLNGLQRLNFQNFTDNKEIALRYAKENNGLVLEIEADIEDILDNFTLEFQNFGKRKANFEIVYVVENQLLTKYSEKWNLKVIRT